MPVKIVPILLIPLIAAYSADLKRGVDLYNTGQYHDAVRSLTSAVKADSQNDLAHYHLANALLKLGRKDDAILEYQRAYALSSTTQMTYNCKCVLDLYKAKIPDVVTRNSRTVRDVAEMSAVTTKSVDQLNELAKKRNNGNWESHPGGPEVFKEAPENGGLIGEEWARWIQNFRLQFNTDLFRELKSRAVQRPSGQSFMVFSVDKNNRLKARILRSNASFIFNDSLLNTTRRLDRTLCLKFPRDSKITGYNFTMGWDYGAPRQVTREEVIAELRRTGTSGQIVNQIGLNAAAGRLRAGDVAASLSSNSVNAQLASQGTNAQLASQGTAGALSAKDANGLPLPSFNTSVSGLVLPREKPVELQATPGVLKVPGEKEEKKSRHHK